MKSYRNLLLNGLTVILFLITACNKTVDAPAPVSSVNAENAFDEDATAASVLTGMYSRLAKETPGLPNGLLFLSLCPGLSADELAVWGDASDKLTGFYSNTIDPNGVDDFWTESYTRLYGANTAIEGLRKATRLTPAVKNQLLGQALFLRALNHFYLTALYGDVPLVTTTDYKINQLISRSAQQDVLKQVIADLKEAKELVNAAYLGVDARKSSDFRITPNKAAVQTLLARAYLFNGAYADAEAEASAVIAQTDLYELSDISQVFKQESREAIWQLQPVNSNWNTEDAHLFVLNEGGPDAEHPAYLQPKFIEAFEAGDQRKTQWTASVTAGSDTWYFPYKYQSATPGDPVTEYKVVFRLAEVYLIRAEALARRNDVTGAQADLNAIRHRAGLDDAPADNTAELLEAVWKERRFELFTENGDRWLTLKRSGTINTVMAAVAAWKASSWNPNKQLYPIPEGERRLNRNLTQNAGY